MHNNYIILFCISVFISSVSQVMLKKSATSKHNSLISEYLNFRVVIAYGLFFMSSVITVIAYKGVPLSMGPVIETSGYGYVLGLSFFILKERITKRQMLGLLLVIGGILISSL